MPPGTPISQLKKIHPPTIASVRVPSSGSMRPPAPPTMPPISTPISQPITETPVDTANPAPPERTTSQEAAPQPQLEAQAQPPVEPVAPNPSSVSPVRPLSQNQHLTPVGVNLPVIANSYHIPVTGFSTAIPNSTSLPFSGQTSNVLSAQQMQNIKIAFAEQAPSMHQLQPATGNIISRVPAPYINHVNGVNYDHLQVRQLHWAQQRIPTNGHNGTTVSQPNGYASAFQQGGVNGIRTNGIAVGHVGQHSSPPLVQSTSPVPNGSLHSSPPRPPSQSSVVSSPSMQTQAVGVNGRYS